jgi:DNA-binding response OmpR family regulator
MMMAASEDYDIMIVDRMLPGMDGLSIINRCVPLATRFQC